MSRIEQVARVAQGYVQAEMFSGVEWQIVQRGDVISEGRVGYANHAQQTPLPEGALYRIMSMTKPIVSLLALQLLEQGRLRLYDMVAQYDERFAVMMVLDSQGRIMPAQRAITIEDLLTHRAGFTYEFIHGCHIAQYYREAEINKDGYRSLDGMMDALAGLPLAFQPGTAWRYSVSIDVLAHIIERATGETLDTLLKQYIFDPLGMTDTGFSVAEADQHRVLPMYGASILDAAPALELQPQVLNELDIETMYPLNKPDTFRRGGLGLYSTTNDYTKFAQMLLTGRNAAGDVVVSRKTLDMLSANRIPADQLPLSIGPNVLAGYGWGLIGRVHLGPGAGMGLSSAGEFGWAGAATTYFWTDPEEQLTGVVMSQYLGSALPLADDMRTAVYQALV